MVLRRTSRFIRTPGRLKRESVTELQCKKAAQEVEADVDKAGMTQ